MKYIITFLALFCFSTSAFAINEIREEDGSPSVFPWQLKVSNGSLTDNGDGTASLATGGGGSSEWTDTGTVLHPADLSGAEDVVVGGTDLTADIVLNKLGTDGIDVNPQSDTDTDLITVGVTGTPKITWDESSNAFFIENGTGVVITEDGNGDLTHTIAGLTVESALELHSDGGTDPGGLSIHRHTDSDALGGHILLMRSDGTHASQGAVDDNDVIGRIVGTGYDGTDNELVAEVQFIVDGTPANNNMPGEIKFFTNAGSQTLTERMAIRADGVVELGNYNFDTDQTVGAGQDNYVLTYDDGDGQISLEAAAGGSLTIGDAIASGTANRVLYEDASNQLAESANLTFDGTTLTIASGGVITSPGSGTRSEVYGSGASATATDSIALGEDADCTGSNSICIGQNADIGQSSTIGIGEDITNAVSGNSVIIGHSADGYGGSEVIIGQGAGGSSGGQNVYIGAASSSAFVTNVDGAVALGYNADNRADGCINIGANSDCNENHTYSIALGANAATTAADQMVVGSSTANITDVYIGEGVTDGTPVAFALNATGGSGTDIAGANITIASGKGTGNANSGNIIFQTSDAGGSGSTLQTLSTKVQITGSSGQTDITASSQALTAQNTTDAASNQVASFMSGNRATAADDDEGYISLMNDNDGGTQTEFARITWIADDVSDASKDSHISFEHYYGNSFVESFYIGDPLAIQQGTIGLAKRLEHIGDTNTYCDFTDDNITCFAGGLQFIQMSEGAGVDVLVINEASGDMDFRVESNTHTDALSINGADGSIDIGGYDCSGNTNGGALTVDASGNLSCSDDDGGGGSAPVWSKQWMPGETSAAEPSDNVAPVIKDAGTNLDLEVAAHDSSTDECRTVQFLVPTDVDTSGTATFYITWYAATAASANVMWDFRWHEVNEGENWDAAVTTDAAAADAADTTQDEITETTWTETLSNLGWTANELVVGMFCRDADNASDTLNSSDAYAIVYGIDIPRA